MCSTVFHFVPQGVGLQGPIPSLDRQRTDARIFKPDMEPSLFPIDRMRLAIPGAAALSRLTIARAVPIRLPSIRSQDDLSPGNYRAPKYEGAGDLQAGLKNLNCNLVVQQILLISGHDIFLQFADCSQNDGDMSRSDEDCSHGLTENGSAAVVLRIIS